MQALVDKHSQHEAQVLSVMWITTATVSSDRLLPCCLQCKNDAEFHSSDSVWQEVLTRESNSAQLNRINPTHTM